MQHSRRSNPYPYTWEIPLAVAVAVLVLLFLGVHLGRAVANFWAGAGLTLPASADLIPSWWAVLTGDAGAGLSPRPEHVASALALRAWITVAQVCIITGLVWVGRITWTQWGPTAVRGVATTDEVEETVGHRRLREQAHVIRPDLYPKKKSPLLRRRATPVEGRQR